MRVQPIGKVNRRTLRKWGAASGHVRPPRDDEHGHENRRSRRLNSPFRVNTGNWNLPKGFRKFATPR